MRTSGSSTLLPDVLLLGYRNGYFPMADPDLDKIMWHRPEQRGIIPLDRVRLSRSLRKEVQRGTFTITVNSGLVGLLEVDDNAVDCDASGCNYTFTGVTSDHSIKVTCL